MPPPYPANQIGILFRRDERALSEKYGTLSGPFFEMEISDQNNQVLWSAESHAVDGNYDLNGLIISDVTWEENDCQADMLSFTVLNPDMRIHDSRLFTEGNSVDLWIGYDGLQPEYMGRGIIVTVEPEFNRDGIPRMSITCYDVSHFMMEEGKAEIQTEGTRWFERHSVPADGAGNSPPQIITTERRDRDDQARQAREDARAAGASPGQVASIPSTSVDRAAPNTDDANTPIRSFEVPGGQPGQDAAQPRNRTAIRQARVPRRRRRRGKVWRNLRDDEIAATIFESYNIVPFVEAVDQNARARRVTREVEDPPEILTTEIRDRADQAADARAQARAAGAPAGTIPAGNIDGSSPTRPVHRRVIRSVEIGGGRRRVTEEVGGRRVVQKAGTSDYEFIKKLAKNHGYIVFVFYYYETGNWIGYWGPPHRVPQHVSYTFEYNNGDDTTLGMFKPKVSMRGQKTEIDLIYTDPVVRRQQRLRVSMENISRYAPEFRGPDATAPIEEPLGNGPEVVLSIHGQRVAVAANRRFASMDDARRWLMAFWYQHASEFCEAEGDCVIGIPEIRCRHRHTISGFGRYDGSYFFTKVTHAIKAGNIYTTDFSTYRVVDMLDVVPDAEGDTMSVESNEMGEITPEARDVIRRWQDALAQR
jgi:hypothetical protein